ncbi:MAG TPA: putative baseplate assembly protein [Pyrinomonadaceae bacterium]|nr:putative baseplate assembly protein [Pyrinomonadaceae bacterium]
MDDVTLQCSDEHRRQLMRDQADEKGGLNGVDFVEVVAGTSQRELCVHFFGEIPQLVRNNVRIQGGSRIRDIKVLEIQPHESADPEHQDCLRVLLDKPGDFSCYRICFYEVDNNGLTTNSYLKNFDPRYACAEFSFKVDCTSELDCLPKAECLPTELTTPEINYLAKDYASFRQMMFDRMSLLVPDWQERHVPDIGVALIEILAYVGDYLSYYQDAVATEAYLDTARQRISVRRHARLVDYFLHEGCNARAWITVWTDQDLNDPSLTLRDLYFATSEDRDAEIFEPLVPDPAKPLELYTAHNKIRFYTWSNQECCLPRGSISATLLDDWIPEKTDYKSQSNKQVADYPANQSELPRSLGHLKVGDVLIFEEVIGPRTGNEDDADHSHRHAVRLTSVTATVDPLIQIDVPGASQKLPTPVVEIEWSIEDALPFHLCLSARLPIPDCSLVTDISVARGNVILVDHGQTIDEPEDLGQVGQLEITGECACDGNVMDLTTVPAKFAPVLLGQPLTFSAGINWSAPAAVAIMQDPRNALPQLLHVIGLPGKCPEPGSFQQPEVLEGIDATAESWKWYSRRDLLSSGSLDQHFVVEMDNDGLAHLRFGDGELGRMPAPCSLFTADYRIGNGTSGNVGADTITTIGWRKETVGGLILKPRNPLPATGGVDREPMAEAKLFAPRAFLKRLERAITADDYARIAERFPGNRVQRAGAALRWTGSGYVAQVSIDTVGSEMADPQLLNDIKDYLYPYRRIAHDIEVQQARYVPLRIEISICVSPHYLRGDVEEALLNVFGNRRLPDGSYGLFHPDNLTFGEGIYLSKLIAAAQAVTGVESVRVTALERLGDGPRAELEEGILKLGPLEVAQLDNDPNFPERGILKLTMRGGR